MDGLFSVLDFETTSLEGDSRPTEIGIVALNQNLLPIDKFESVIRPPIEASMQSLAYARLSRDQLGQAPTFSAIWPLAAPFFNGRVIVAHNKSFEIGVLARALGDSKIPLMDFPFICTYEWSQKILKNKLERFRLPDLCAYFDVELIDAHEAIADAQATAEIFKHLYETSDDLRLHCQKLADSTVGFVAPVDTLQEPLIRRRIKATSKTPLEIEAVVREIRSNSKIKIVVATGTLIMSETKFAALVEQAGYTFKDSPTTAGTAFVIQGYNGGQSKIQKAGKYGRPVLTEADGIAVLRSLIGS
jgi:DNA polymerase III epsilon subunit-like protein